MRYHNLIEPVYKERALIVGDALVVGDLHLGLEWELRERGIAIKPQWEDMRNKLFDLLNSHSVNKLIILGDLKHNVPKASRGEYRKLPKLLKEISECWEVIIIKGNHDGLLEELLSGSFKVLKSFQLGRVLFAHGHTIVDPGGYKFLILGHNHPCVEFSDELGYGPREPVWMRSKLNKFGMEYFGISRSPTLIIVPAFNEMLSGTPLNSNAKLLGPLFNNNMVRLNDAEVFLLDGTSLGALKNLPRRDSFGSYYYP
jgi:hypothetical protein